VKIFTHANVVPMLICE